VDIFELGCLRRPTFDGAKVGKTPFFLQRSQVPLIPTSRFLRKPFKITDYVTALHYRDFFAETKSNLYIKGRFLF
jgi:hypothetical protein